MALSEEIIRFLIESARAKKEAGVSQVKIDEELVTIITQVSPDLSDTERTAIISMIDDAIRLEPGERAKEFAQRIEGFSSRSEAVGERARWLAAQQARIGGWDRWPQPWGPRRPFLEEARDRVAAGWKHAKSAGLSLIGDKEGAYRELRHIEEMKEKRQLEGVQRAMVVSLLKKRREYREADTDEERKRIGDDIKNLISQQQNFGNLKSQYYSLGKSIGSAGRVARSPLMGKISNASSGWEPKRAAMMEPAERSRLNKARKELMQFANQFFRGMLATADKDAKQAQEQLTKAKDYYEKTRKDIEREISGREGGANFLGSLAKVPEGDALGAITGKLGKSPVPKDKVRAEELREAFEIYMRSKASAENLANTASTEGKLAATEATMNRHIEELKKKYKLGEVAEGILAQEKDALMFRFRAQYKNRFMKGFAALRMFSRNMTMGAMTWGDVWLNFWYNIRDLIFGPWVWGTLLVVLQWVFVTNFIQIQVPNALYFVAPIGIGALTLMFNIGASGKPWDWLTHFVSGMLIGFSAIIMAVTVITPEDMGGWESRQWFTFWFIWGGATVFLGIFSFYQSGGFLFVFQLSILILLFGWLALGPYRAVYADIIDSIRAPIRFVWDSFRSAFEDVWLLATNPQEYFARQQLKNVRTVSSISLPDGVEITAIDVEPMNPALSTKGETNKQSFTVSAEIRNKGIGDAKNVRAWVGCDSFCNNETVNEEGYKASLLSAIILKPLGLVVDETKLTVELALQAVNTVAQVASGEKTVENVNNMAKIAGNIISIPFNNINEINARFKTIRDEERVKGFIELKKGDAQVVRFSDMRSYEMDMKSKAYLITATATVYVEYDYATSSSLSVQVASEDEYSRVLRDGTLNPVVARGAKTPAQISLSVGRQPLRAGGKYELIVSVINTRSDGHVFLNKDTPIIIRMPASVGSSLTCGNGAVSSTRNDDYYQITVKPNGYVDIQPNKFSSLFAFSCTFTAAPATETKTGLITAKLDNYGFRAQKDVKVRYSPPTGTSGLVKNDIVGNAIKAGTAIPVSAKLTLLKPVILYKDALPDGKNGESLKISKSMSLKEIDDKVSAVEIPSSMPAGASVTLYEHDNYRGRCLNILKTTSDISASSLHVDGASLADEASSVGIYADWAIPSMCLPDGTFNSPPVIIDTTTKLSTVVPIVFLPTDYYQNDDEMVQWFASTATNAQIFYAAKNGGNTFRRFLVVGVRGEHNGEWYWCNGTNNKCDGFGGNVLKELATKGYTDGTNRILWILAMGGGAFAGGDTRGPGGYAIIGDAGVFAGIDGNCQRLKDEYFPNEAYYADGKITAKEHCPSWIEPGNVAGGIVGTFAHELGHAFGIPHPDGYGYAEGDPVFTKTVMSNAGDYPYVGLIDEDRNRLKNNPYFTSIMP